MLPVGTFRCPAPGSQGNYQAPPSTIPQFKSYYFQRESRRKVPQPLVIINNSSTAALTATTGDNGLLSSTATANGNENEIKLIAPGRPYKYKQSQYQPNGSGYYPIYYVE